MLKGIILSLMIGPAVPVPAPQAVIDALTSVQVSHDKDRSGFQLTFAVSKKSMLMKTLLPAGYFDPVTTRVVIIATVAGFPHVLMDGFVTQQQLQPSNEPGQSTLTITGEDLSLAMDLVEFVIPYPAVPEVGIVNLILAKYAALGIIPLVLPPFIPKIGNPTQDWPTQPSMTDREYLKYLANEAGFVFFIRPGPVPMTSTAYFGPDVNIPVPQPALTINMDAHSNVDSLSFSLNGLQKKLRIFKIYDPITRRVPITIPVPNINLFKPPLGARPTPPARIELEHEGSSLRPDQAAASILGFMLNNSSDVTGSGSLDVLRFGHVLHSRLLVGVRGAGLAYDGMYYVDSVTHNLKRGEYKQNFTLSRDGLISNVPRVMT